MIPRKIKKILLLCGCLWIGVGTMAGQEKPISVFDAYRVEQSQWMAYRHLDQAWYDQLHQMAEGQIRRRARRWQQIDDLRSWESYALALKEKLLLSIGGLPEKTPLQPEVVAVLERPDFRVEKLLYQSLPGFYVTAALFVPKERQNPAPAIIYCSGHSQTGFRSETYQHVILNLVKKGFIVLAFDPIGQGERYQYLDEKGQPRRGGPTKEHSYAGIQCLLVGQSLARYMIHDGIRAVDYLLSRPEVDSKRIGITGRSGGGTQSAYIAALDPRIRACAQENYITSFQRLWQSIGPQDAEQNLPMAHPLGLDHGDLLAIRTPKPALVLTTSRDFFSLQGAKETFAAVQEIYRLYDAADQLHWAEDDHQHGSTQANREAMYAFFQESLNLPGSARDEEVELFSETELTITPTGQVLSARKAESTFSLLQDQLSRYSEEMAQDSLAYKLAELFHLYASSKPGNPIITGRINRGDYVIEKHFLEPVRGRPYPLPFVWVKDPRRTKAPLALYLNSEGKSSALGTGGEIESLVREGYQVIAPDLLNVGELSNEAFRGDSQIESVSYNLVWGSSLMGTSLVSLQTRDLLTLLAYLDQPIQLAVADQGLCLPLAHVSAMGLYFEEVQLRHPLVSWSDLLQTKDYAPKWASMVVPGAWPAYDIPDLMAASQAKKLTIFQALNARGLPLGKGEGRQAYRLVKEVFAESGREFQIQYRTN